MKKAIIFIIILMTGLSSCSQSAAYPLYESEENGEILESENEEIIEIIQDLGGREITIAAAWPYLSFVTAGPGPEPGTSRNYTIDRLFYEQVQRSSQEYNVHISEILIEHSQIMPTLQASVMAGRPFADIVLLGGEMVFPAITGNLIYALEEFMPRESSLWGKEHVLRPTASFMDFHWTFAPHAFEKNGVFLGVNLDIIRAIGAENPLHLLERDEWTFERFREILIKASLQEGYQFGISGVPGEIISHLIAANGGTMVYNFNYAFDDTRTVEALEFAYKIFYTDRTWQYHYGIHNWHRNFFAFEKGRSAFFPISEWALQQASINFPYAIIPFPKGPDNRGAYSFMKGFDMGLAIPRGTKNPEDLYTVLEGIFQWAGEGSELLEQREHSYLIGYFPSQADFMRAQGILREQGKFDMGMVVPTFNWMNSILAEGFFNGDLNARRAVEMFRSSQQEILDIALENWLSW